METGISVLCRATKGTFMSEYFVKIKKIDNTWWEGAVDKEMVFDLDEEPSDGDCARGRIYAYLISYNNGQALIELPIENSTAGRRINVSSSILRKEEVPA